jgi:hypothetical protein
MENAASPSVARRSSRKSSSSFSGVSFNQLWFFNSTPPPPPPPPFYTSNWNIVSFFHSASKFYNSPVLPPRFFNSDLLSLSLKPQGDLPAEEVANLRSTGGSVTDAAINSLGEELTHLNDTKKELENDILETQEAQVGLSPKFVPKVKRWGKE